MRAGSMYAKSSRRSPRAMRRDFPGRRFGIFDFLANAFSFEHEQQVDVRFALSGQNRSSSHAHCCPPKAANTHPSSSLARRPRKPKLRPGHRVRCLWFGGHSLGGFHTFESHSHRRPSIHGGDFSYFLTAKLIKVRSAKLASTTMSPATRIYH
jgi:hypothetical protein